MAQSTKIKNTGALISDCSNYRYWLSRSTQQLFADKERLVFIMLNPSTADAYANDNTLNRCLSFSCSWGYKGLIIVNLYAMRSTDPRNLWKSNDPIGSENNWWITEACDSTNADIVCAWGNEGEEDRVREIRQLLKPYASRLVCLGITGKGAPRHPLYVNSNQPLIPYT